MAKTASANGKGFFKQLRAAFSGLSQCRDVRLDQPLQLRKERIRVLNKSAPLELILGKNGKKLHLVTEVYLDAECAAERAPKPTFILYDPECFFKKISGFLRLREGDTLTLGREDEHQQALFDYPKGVAQRHLMIVHEGEALLFKNLLGNTGTYIAPLPEKAACAAITELRMERLREIRTIFGGPIEQLDPEAALDTLKRNRSHPPLISPPFTQSLSHR